jgi:maltose alpha-D-glucosyltransferase/alpha-amylase
VEVGWFLTEHSQFRGTPAVAGSLEYVRGDDTRASLALLQEFVANRGDAWSTTQSRLADVLRGVDPAESIASVARLGQTTADLHLALASGAHDFTPEPISADDVAAWRNAIREEVSLASEALRQRGIAVDLRALLHRADGVTALLGAPKIRHHGDYHLGQVLERSDGTFAIIDFEGEPAKPLDQRREKRSPLRDVAGMLRSLDYARHAALRAAPGADPASANGWYRAAREAFLDTYVRDIREHNRSLLPPDVAAPLAALELEKAAYEVLYELNNRPDWLPIPLAALR